MTGKTTPAEPRFRLRVQGMKFDRGWQYTYYVDDYARPVTMRAAAIGYRDTWRETVDAGLDMLKRKSEGEGH